MKEQETIRQKHFSKITQDLGAKSRKTQAQLRTELELSKGLSIADLYLTQHYLDFFANAEIVSPKFHDDESTTLNVCQVTKIVFDPKEQINDKLISVFGSLYSLQSAISIIISSNGSNIDFYIATRNQDNPELAGTTLVGALRGNFPGIDIKKPLEYKEVVKLLDSFSNEEYVPKSLSTVSIIPSERDEDKEKFIQGLEKFLASMNGKIFTAILLATPITENMLSKRKRGFS